MPLACSKIGALGGALYINHAYSLGAGVVNGRPCYLAVQAVSSDAQVRILSSTIVLPKLEILLRDIIYLADFRLANLQSLVVMLLRLGWSCLYAQCAVAPTSHFAHDRARDTSYLPTTANIGATELSWRLPRVPETSQSSPPDPQ